MAKKINLAKFVIVLISIMILTIQINANFSIVNAPEIMIGEKRGTNTYAVRVYPFNYESEMNFYGGTLTNETFFAAYFMSAIKPNTFYKYSIDIELQASGQNILTGTGTVIPNNFVYFTIADKRIFANVDSSKIAQTQGFTTSYEMNLIDDNFYTMFYDANNEQLSVIFYIPQSYYDQHPELIYHSYLFTSIGTYNGDITAKLKVSEYTGTEIQGDYSAILKQISNKLDALSAAGGGLTEEQIQNAINEALETEKQEAESTANSALDDLTSALGGVTGQITQAQNSFETLAAALSHNGTNAQLTLPAMTIPFLGTVSESYEIDLTQQFNEIMPPTLLLLIRCATSLGIVSYPIYELIRQLRKLLDKG